jgi:ubiquinone/menaquinone biosynthesis C-methylase UbiE
LITAIKEAVGTASRRSRAALFNKLLDPRPNVFVLDLGGGKGRHMAKFFPSLTNVCVADHNRDALDHAKAVYGFKTQIIDGGQRLPFDDGHVDIVFCSSVIEHVTGPKAEAVQSFKMCGRKFRAAAWEYQLEFAKEIRRVSKSYFVQTPNRHFPIETHSWLPLVGMLPTDWQWKIISIFNRFWPRKDANPDWSLLTYREMQRLFPDAKIYRERFFGLTKSFIAIRT